MIARGERSRSLAVADLDGLPADAARELFRGCCAAGAWAAAMVASRPFGSLEALQLAAARAFDRLGEEDWLEAFGAHPQIGDLDALRKRYGPHAVEGEEQAAAVGAAPAVLEALAAGNAEYRRRFGFVFLVFATGKTADQMLGILRRRLASDRATELEIAAEEQRKITALRLERLVGAPQR